MNKYTQFEEKIYEILNTFNPTSVPKSEINFSFFSDENFEKLDFTIRIGFRHYTTEDGDRVSLGDNYLSRIFADFILEVATKKTKSRRDFLELASELETFLKEKYTYQAMVVDSGFSQTEMNFSFVLRFHIDEETVA